MAVTPIRPDVVIDSPTKQQFLDTVASQFDQFFEITGQVPAMLAYVFVATNGDAAVSWATRSDCEELTTLLVSRALTKFQAESVEAEQYEYDCGEEDS